MSDERSSFSIGLTFLTTTVSISDESKQCVAATTTCSEHASSGMAPEHESASSRSKARSFSVRCSAV